METLQKKPLATDELKELDIAIVYLFGSQAEGTAGEGSDIDIGIVLKNPAVLQGGTTALYQKLYDLFTDVFDMSNFRTIDIVFLDRASLELRFDAVQHGIALYEDDPDFRDAFEERTALLYRDFAPLRRMFDEAVLAKIP